MTANFFSSESCFIDSNIWFYAFNHRQDAAKHQLAKRLVSIGNLWISTQVINEVCKNLIQKAEFDEQQIARLIASFYKRCQVVTPSKAVLLRASGVRYNYQLSFWDSLIVSSALTSGVKILYSEDMQDGIFIENQLTIMNPFNCR
jgi:predicted nucleic acid-binding protein